MRRYWLFKSEPRTFSIQALSQCVGQTTHWDGVRNYQVRNLLRDEIQEGDLGFFYHSSCPIPGIVGVIEVVKAGYPDWTAWDADSPFFDPNGSFSHPRWFMVDVKLVQIFQQIITLAQLKQHPRLKQMWVNRRGNRLSITPVHAAEWAVIMKAVHRSNR
jgi:predicted RNA-binding protein with PUA-like domain